MNGYAEVEQMQGRDGWTGRFEGCSRSNQCWSDDGKCDFCGERDGKGGWQ